MGTLRVVINGAGAAGIAIGKHLINMGFGNVILCDINGIICEGDAIGAVALMSREPRAKFGDAEMKLASTAAGFLGRQMEG